MLLTITISTLLAYFITALIMCSAVFFSGLLMIHGHKKYKEGLILGQSLYDGKPIKLDKNWVGTTFYIKQVFKKVSLASHVGILDDEYLLEASDHIESEPRLFIITEDQFKQLLIDGDLLGKEYEYTSKVSHPGLDIYYFQRYVGMHDEG